MTRAQQTMSLALLASSVSLLPPSFIPTTFKDANISSIYPQLYLACFLHIIPSTKTIQDEIIPVVRFPPFPFPSLPFPYREATMTPAVLTWSAILVPVLGPRLVWIVPAVQAGVGRLHVQ